MAKVGYELIADIGVPKWWFGVIVRPEVGLYLKLFIFILEHVCDEFCCESSFSVTFYLDGINAIIMDDMLFSSLQSSQ